jgi:glycosyltransferase involved in cell wall biosynthesis
MRPIRLAVIFDQQIHAGGGYQQALNAALITKSIATEIAESVFFTTVKDNVPVLASYGIEAQYLSISFADKIAMFFRREIWSSHLLGWITKFSPLNAFEAALSRKSIDLVYFLSPDGRYRDLERTNYIATVWDLCHRDDPEFPEVRWNRQAEIRDRNYSQFLPKATAIFVDSDFSRRNIVHRYGLDIDRVHVMAFEASMATQSSATATFEEYQVDIKKKYGLKEPYIFYPAQFWAHKNHIYLLQGLADLRSRYGLDVGAMFVGSDKGNLEYVKKSAISLGVLDLVRFGGFVSNEEIPVLYKQSVALVMPTYFGPTNLPPLEAFELGVPVLYPDKPGLREQVGDAALLMDLKKPSSLADHLYSLLTNDTLRSQLIAKGQDKLKVNEKGKRAYLLESVITDFRSRRMCWE